LCKPCEEEEIVIDTFEKRYEIASLNNVGKVKRRQVTVDCDYVSDSVISELRTALGELLWGFVPHSKRASIDFSRELNI
jgi:hypothetical protein